MPREILLRMHLTSHMTYDCAPEDQESGILAENPDLPASISFEPADQEQLESDTEEINEQETDNSSGSE